MIPEKKRQGILFTVMPFHNTRSPNFGVSILQSVLKQNNFNSEAYYANIDFLDFVGTDMAFKVFELEMLSNDIIFAHLIADKNKSYKISEKHLKIDIYRKSVEVAEQFIDFAAKKIVEKNYALVGFTLIFQSAASLALAKRVKELSPDTKIILGGSNCEGEMGEAIHRNFRWVDYVCYGAGEQTVVQLASHLFDKTLNIEDVKGLIWRNGEKSIVNRVSDKIDINTVPLPDFDDWYAQIQDKFNIEEIRNDLLLPIESSRGCWYGHKSQCVFCGLSGKNLAPNVKKPESVINEIDHFIEQYNIRNFIMADLIFPKDYYKTFLPKLKNTKNDISLIYEVRANITKDKLQLFRDAQILYLQPGIESLDTYTLQTMNKGTKTFQNIRLLKFAPQFGISLIWNIIYGVPGEKSDAYDNMASLIPKLVHLQPPLFGVFPIVLQRFSPMFNNMKKFGITEYTPIEKYNKIYELPDEELRNLAYYFDYKSIKLTTTHHAPKLKSAVKNWLHQAGEAVLISIQNKNEIYFCDTRPGQTNETFNLNEKESQVYLACEEGSSLSEVIKKTGLHKNSVSEILDKLVGYDIVLFIDDVYLSIAVNMDAMSTSGLDMEMNLYICASYYRTWMRKKCNELLKVGKSTVKQS